MYKPTRGDVAYACRRNQHRAHDLMMRALKHSGLTQKQLAAVTGIDEATISRTLRSPKNIELNTLSKILYGTCGAMLELTPGLVGDYPADYSEPTELSDEAMEALLESSTVISEKRE